MDDEDRSWSLDRDPVGNPPTVLVVDDEELICESLRTYLVSELEDVRVYTANSADTGLDILRQERVDVVLADHKMPGMTGLDMLIQVGDRFPSVARVLMTAYPDVKLAQQAINQGGVDRFFTKPLDPDEVVATVRDLIARRDHEAGRSGGLSRGLDRLRRR